MADTQCNNAETILRAILRNPDGPIVLWHYTDVTSPAHKRNLAQVNATCTGPGNGVLEFAGGYWKLTCRGADSGGFAVLIKLDDTWKPKEKATYTRAEDPKKMWLEYLYAHNLARPGQQSPHLAVQPGPVTEYDYGDDDP